VLTFEGYYQSATDQAPSLHQYISLDLIRNPEEWVDENKDWNISDVLWAPRIYDRYPWIERNVTINFARSSHRNLNGEIIRIVTLGGGEGTIYVNIDAWDDAVDGQNPNEKTKHLVYAIVHELGHAVDDHEGNLEYSTPEEISRAEKFATDFANKYGK
jgi:hypothetical protein